MFTIPEWRRVKNISMLEMSSLLGVHYNTYRRWEEDPSSIKMGFVEKIAKILEVDISDIKF